MPPPDCICSPNSSRDRPGARRDNCLVPRTAVLKTVANATNATNATAQAWSLSECAFPDGGSAYADLDLGDASVAFNETSFWDQFADNQTNYRSARRSVGGVCVGWHHTYC